MKLRDRHIIYLILLVALAVPKLFDLELPSVRFKNAQTAFDVVEQIKADGSALVFVALDFGPNTVGENRPQAETLIEHLMIRGVPFILSSQYSQAKSLLEEIPQKVADRLNVLQASNQLGETGATKNKRTYGKDWVNIGFRPGAATFLQQLAKSKSLINDIKSDARGNNLKDLPIFEKANTFKQISHVVQITGLTGTLNNFMEFFTSPEHRPKFIHGCTSIVIPEAYIYLDSKQLNGLLEGVAGAAWYSELLHKRFGLGDTENTSAIFNTMISVGHLVLIFFVALGNLLFYLKRKQGAK